MARKNSHKHLLASGQSLASDFNSDAVNVEYLDNVAISIETSGITDNTGQFTLQGKVNESSWLDITLDPAIAALADVDTNFLIELSNFPYSQFRIKFVAAGGTPDGECTINIQMKMI